MGFLERGSNPPHQLGNLRERCELPQRGSGGPRPPPRFSTNSRTQDGLSRHYNVVNCGLSCSHCGAGGGSNKLRMSEGDVSHVSPSGGELMRELLLSSPV